MKRRKIFILNLLLILIISAIFMPISQATAENTIYETESTVSTYNPISTNISRAVEGNDLIGKEFFIKNACSGQYLDVSGGIAANGTNVQQYKYNGTDSQKWYMHYNGDGTYTIFTKLGSENGYAYALDISNGSTENYANVQIYRYNLTDSQKFQLGIGTNDAFVFFSKVTNYSKAIVLNGPTFNQGGNVDQYTFQNHINEFWILEPVEKSAKLGVEYAKANWNNYMYAYPNVSKLGDDGGDCANFVSQCMLASGIHYQNSWYTYRKNENYSAPTTIAQLDNTWELADPSPWISAKQFRNYWKERVTTHAYKGSEITANPSLILNIGITVGDVVQIAGNMLGIVWDAQHTMYIKDYGSSGYIVTYHTGNTENQNLLDLCAKYPNLYFVFYEVM